MYLLEHLPYLGNGNFIKVIKRRIRNNLIRSMRSRSLSANLIHFGLIHRLDALPITTIRNPFPCHHDISRRSRNLEHKNPFAINHNRNNLPKSQSVSRMLRKIMLQIIQSLLAILI